MSLSLDLERALYSQSLRDFIRGNGPRIPASDDDPDVGVRNAWDIMEPGTSLEWNWHLDAICEHLEAVSCGEIQDLVVTVPPRTLKTSVISIGWPAWEWTHTPTTKYLGGSHDGDLAIDIAVMSRRVLEHPWYRRRWGSEFEIVSDQNVKSYYRNNRGGTRRSMGVAGSPTGKGADVLLLDDPIDVEKAHREIVRKQALSWWKQLHTRLNNPRTGKKVVVMQRVHEDDVAGWCIDNGYVHLNLPNEFDPKRRCITVRKPLPTPEVPKPKKITWKDPRTKQGELLFPSRIDAEVIAKVRASIGSLGYEPQYNQRTEPSDEDSWFPPGWWQLWHALPTNPDGTMRRPDDALVVWDMTFKGKTGQQAKRTKEPDYVVGQLWYRYGAETFLIDEVRGQWSFTQAVKQVAAFDERCRTVHPFPPTRHVVETKANGEAILDQMRPVVPGMVGFNPDPYGDKVARALACQPRVEASQVWLPAAAPWLEAWRHELKVFPHGANDDRVDGFSMAHLVTQSGGGWKAV